MGILDASRRLQGSWSWRRIPACVERLTEKLFCILQKYVMVEFWRELDGAVMLHTKATNQQDTWNWGKTCRDGNNDIRPTGNSFLDNDTLQQHNLTDDTDGYKHYCLLNNNTENHHVSFVEAAMQ